MKYQHCFIVHAPVECVAGFHRDPRSMAAITPPPILVRAHTQPDRVEEGASMTFTMWLGPLPIPWQAAFEKVTPLGFSDRQLRGPFQHWLHQHRFLPLDDRSTLVLDEVQVVFRRHPWWGLVGRLMWMGLPVLFAFRGWKTRRLLEKC